MTPKIQTMLEMESISVRLVDSDLYQAITLRTDDVGGGAYLRIEIEAPDKSLSLNCDELDQIAALGRRLVDLVDGKSLSALMSDCPETNTVPDRGVGSTAAGVSPRTR